MNNKWLSEESYGILYLRLYLKLQFWDTRCKQKLNWRIYSLFFFCTYIYCFYKPEMGCASLTNAVWTPDNSLIFMSFDPPYVFSCITGSFYWMLPYSLDFLGMSAWRTFHYWEWRTCAVCIQAIKYSILQFRCQKSEKSVCHLMLVMTKRSLVTCSFHFAQCLLLFYESNQVLSI